jgi:hypothetical protein
MKRQYSGSGDQQESVKRGEYEDLNTPRIEESKDVPDTDVEDRDFEALLDTGMIATEIMEALPLKTGSRADSSQCRLESPDLVVTVGRNQMLVSGQPMTVPWDVPAGRSIKPSTEDHS